MKKTSSLTGPEAEALWNAVDGALRKGPMRFEALVDKLGREAVDVDKVLREARKRGAVRYTMNEGWRRVT